MFVSDVFFSKKEWAVCTFELDLPQQSMDYVCWNV